MPPPPKSCVFRQLQDGGIEPTIIPPRHVMFVPPPALLFLPEISTALLVAPNNLGPIAALIQLVASRRVLFLTSMTCFSTVAPVKVITNDLGSGEGVDGGGRNVA